MKISDGFKLAIGNFLFKLLISVGAIVVFLIIAFLTGK